MSPSSNTISYTYDLGRPEFGGEPGVVAELALAYSAAGELLREAAHGGDEGGFATPAARDDRVRLLLRAARGAVARDTVPERARQQPSSPVDGLHRARCDINRKSRSPPARDQHQRD